MSARIKGWVEEQLMKAMGIDADEAQELKADIAWARAALRRARKHFLKGYAFMILGSTLLGVERVLPPGPLQVGVALAGVACLALSAMIYWIIIR